MSLEQAIAENTSALKELIALMKKQPQPEVKATAEPQAESKVEQKTAPAEPATQPTTQSEGITRSAIIALVNKACDAKGTQVVKDILKSFGVARFGELPEAKWLEFAKVLQEGI